MRFPTNIDCYIIVIKNNEASEYYANYCIKSWSSFGLDVKIFDAVIPEMLPNLTYLKWTKYSTQDKYRNKGLKVKITDTEKACFTSHYLLWRKSAIENKSIFILEHDAYLEKPENLWYDENCGIIHFDKAAMGSYVIMPWFAKKLINEIKTIKIGTGPYGYLLNFSVLANLREKYINQSHPLYVAASNQVMSKKYGSTVEHYYNSDPNLIKEFGLHKFKMI